MEVAHQFVDNTGDETVLDDGAARVTSREDIRRVVEGFLEVAAAVHGPAGVDVTPSDLVALEQGEPTKPGAPAPRRVRHELAFRTVRYNESGILNRVAQADFRNMVYTAYAAARDGVIQVQPGGDWRLVAAELERDSMVKVFADRDVESDPSASSFDDLMKAASGKAKLNDTTTGERADRVLVIRLVFANMAPDSMSDPAERLGAKPIPQLQKYLQTGDVRHMPRGMARERKSAVPVICALYGVTATVVDEDGNVVEEAKPTAPSKLDVLEPKVRKLTEKELSMAETLLAGGHKVGAVATLLDVHHNTLKAALKGRDLDAKVPADAGVDDGDDLGLPSL